MSERIAVLGAGSWGTALAHHCARIGHDVRLWGRDPALVEQIKATRENSRYLPGIRLSSAITVTSSVEVALGGAAIVIAAVPSHGMRDVLRHAAPAVARRAIL